MYLIPHGFFPGSHGALLGECHSALSKMVQKLYKILNLKNNVFFNAALIKLT